MSKLLFALIFSFLSIPATALDGKVQLINKFHDDGAVYKPMLGLNLHHNLHKVVGLNLWTGASEEPTDSGEDVRWWVTKGNVDMYFGKLIVSPGYHYGIVHGIDQYDAKFRKNKEYVFLKLEYKLF
jgi:hypothetical protein